MEKRPKLTIPPTPLDKTLDILAFLGLALIWVYVIYNYANLPDRITTHFNIKGEVNGHGSKNTLWLLPSIATIIIIGFSFMSRIPHQFNYMVKITPENALQQYTLALKMMRYLKIVILLIFTYIIYTIVQNAQQSKDGMSHWFLPLSLCLTFLPTAVLIYYSYKKKLST
jgi:uncharacterized membrane protein